MVKNERISERELTFIMANLLSVKAIFSFPRSLFEFGANAAWAEVVFIFLIALTALEISFLAYRQTGKKSIIDIAGKIGGKPLKIAVSGIVILVLSINFSAQLGIFSRSVKLILLPKTDIEYIMILLAFTIYIGQKRGLSAIAAVNAIFFPICLIFLGFIVVFLYKTYDMNNLFPIFGNGIADIFEGGIKSISCFGDILAVNLLLPHLKDIDVPKKSGRKALIIAFFTILSICLCYALCYPYPMTKEYLLPVYQLSKLIRAGEYFQRFEAFFEFVWEISLLLYSAIYAFLICETASKAFNLNDRNAISLSIIAILAMIAAEPSAITENLKVTHLLTLWSAPWAYLLPIIIPIIYMKKERKKEKR